MVVIREIEHGDISAEAGPQGAARRTAGGNRQLGGPPAVLGEMTLPLRAPLLHACAPTAPSAPRECNKTGPVHTKPRWLRCAFMRASMAQSAAVYWCAAT